ncbi:5-bromo-4-chloroindolyl phosphate hydrolysis family protein [Slackia isoflavoniconvertens]|uniref:5-bromo-4-chloroindolyl phosphate hydrolysis family protein n=1 Tax=Slackia isoflavoniconvertens TaxID=572010 RepID=UPI003AF08DB6
MASSKNIGDQIFNAVQNAVDSQDFSNLQSTIEKSIGIAAEGIARGLSSASDGIRRGREQYALAQAKKRREEQMATIYANPSGQRSVGIALVGWGVVLGVPGLAGTFFTIGAGSILVGSILAAATVAGGALFAMGIKRLNLVNRFERYRDAIGLRDFCYLDEIAASTADTTENVRQNVKAMLSHGLFKQAALGDGENFLALTNDAYQQYRQARGKALEKKQQQALTQSEHLQLDAETQALLARGNAYIAQIRESNKAIPNPEFSKKIDQIEHVVRTIFERAAERPEVIDDLDHLMDYYLPTTVKLLDAYRDLDAQPIQSETISQSKREIEGALDSLNVAFEKLLDSVFRDMAIDVSSDISVLHTVLAQEGLVESPFDKQKSE